MSKVDMANNGTSSFACVLEANGMLEDAGKQTVHAGLLAIGRSFPHPYAVHAGVTCGFPGQQRPDLPVSAILVGWGSQRLDQQ